MVHLSVRETTAPMQLRYGQDRLRIQNGDKIFNGTPRECARENLVFAGQHTVRWAMTIDEGSDIDNHLIPHLDASFDCRAAHMG